MFRKIIASFRVAVEGFKNPPDYDRQLNDSVEKMSVELRNCDGYTLRTVFLNQNSRSLAGAAVHAKKVLEDISNKRPAPNFVITAVSNKNTLAA